MKNNKTKKWRVFFLILIKCQYKNDRLLACGYTPSVFVQLLPRENCRGDISRKECTTFAVQQFSAYSLVIEKNMANGETKQGKKTFYFLFYFGVITQGLPQIVSRKYSISDIFGVI